MGAKSKRGGRAQGRWGWGTEKDPVQSIKKMERHLVEVSKTCGGTRRTAVKTNFGRQKWCRKTPDQSNTAWKKRESIGRKKRK